MIFGRNIKETRARVTLRDLLDNAVSCGAVIIVTGKRYCCVFPALKLDSSFYDFQILFTGEEDAYSGNDLILQNL